MNLKLYQAILLTALCFININCIEIYLHTKLTINSKPEVFSLTSTNINATINTIKNKNYLCWLNKEECTTYFIIHGFMSDANKSWVLDMKKELFKLHNKTGLVNVFAVNWPSGKLPTEYKKVVEEDVPSTVNELEETVSSILNTEYLQRNETTLFIHCIGHSLGKIFFCDELKNN